MAETGQGVFLQVMVSTEGSEFALIGFDEWANALKVRLRSKAEKGKANQELVEKLEKIFNAKVEVLNGKKSRKKRLLVKASKQHVLECLSGLFGNQ